MKNKKYKTGRCFEETYNFVSLNPDEYNIVHCICTNTLTGLPMVHSFAQTKDGSIVRDIDKNAYEVFIQKDIYSKIGNIQKETIYTLEEYTNVMLSYQENGYTVCGCFIPEYCKIENESRRKMIKNGIDIELEDYSYLGEDNV